MYENILGAGISIAIIIFALVLKKIMGLFFTCNCGASEGLQFGMMIPHDENCPTNQSNK